MSKSKISSKSSTSKVDDKLLDALKHYDSFYEKPPPGLIQDQEKEKPEDVIPDTPENSAAREFLAKAPTKGLWMPLGKEVKVMKCWRCKNYGHRTGDKECPMFMTGNREAEEFRHTHEDPMYNYVKESEIRQKFEKVEMLKSLLHNKEKKEKTKKRKKESKKKASTRKHHSSDSSDSDTSSSSSESSKEYSSHRKRHKHDSHKKPHKKYSRH